MIWKPVGLEDQTLIGPKFAIRSYPISDYNFTHLCIWSDLYNIKYTNIQDFLVISGVDPLTQKPYIYMPIGNGNLNEVLIQLWQQSPGKPLTIRAVTQDMIKEFSCVSNCFNWHYGADRGEFEYLYKIDKFKNYIGKELRRKREQCHAFENRYCYSFTPYKTSDLPQVLALLDEWYGQYMQAADPIVQGERKGVLALLKHYDTYKCKGFVVKVAQKAIGFVLTEALTDEILVIHFEKGNRNYKGIYDLMKRELARYYDGSFKYISLEEDMGIVGLRKAKSMYRPDCLIEKGYIELEVTERGLQNGE